jgi:hypothetical protein
VDPVDPDPDPEHCFVGSQIAYKDQKATMLKRNKERHFSYFSFLFSFVKLKIWWHAATLFIYFYIDRAYI